MNSNAGIISLISSATEILYSLGLGDQVAAVSHECDYPAEANQKPRATFSRVDSGQSSVQIDQQVQEVDRTCGLYGIERELICRLRPALIVTQSQCDVCAVRYEDVAAMVGSEPALIDTTLVDLNPHSLEDVFADIQKIAESTDRLDIATSWTKQLQDRIAQIQTATEALTASERPRVACIEWTDPLMLAANWTPDLISIAGGQCPNRGGGHSGYTTWNEIRAYNPEVIVVSPCGFDVERTLVEAAPLAALPGWQDTIAAETQRVFAVDGNAYLNRSGPRLVDSVEILAHLVQPELFPTAAIPSGAAWCQLNSADAKRMHA